MSEAQSDTMQTEPTATYSPVSGEPVRETASFTPVVTYTLIALNVAIFFVMVARGVGFIKPTALEVLPWGANLGPLTTSGQWWRLLTACFLHFGIIHILMNMYILLQAGPFAEKLFGRARYLALYLLAGIGGNIAGLYVHPLVTSAGASGAIFGVYGGFLAFLLVRRGVVPSEQAVAIAKSAGIFLVYNVIYGAARAGTDLTAHIGGLVVGFGVGCLLAWAGSSEPMRLVTAFAAIVVVMGGSIAKIPKSSNFATAEILGAANGNVVTVGKNDRVIYSGGATKSDAEALGKALLVTSLFDDPNQTILLRKESGKTTVSIPLKGDETLSPTYDDVSSKLVNGQTVVTHTTKNRPPLPWKSPAALLRFNMVGPVLASALGGPPLTLELTNGKGEPRSEVAIVSRAVTVGEHDNITYTGEVTEAQARTVGSALVASGFLKDRGVILALSKDARGTVMSLIVRDAAVQNPALWTGMESVGRQIAPAVGGLPLTVRLLGASGTVSKDIPVN